MKTPCPIRLAAALLAVLLGGCSGAPLPTHTAVAGRTGPGSAGAPPPPAPAAQEPEAVAGITAAHNRVRARVGVPPLRWNAELAEVARRWANACVDREPPRGMIDHSTGRSDAFAGPLGENLYATTAPVADPVEALRGWADEAKDYDYARNACAPGAMCGHYTQVVWRTTREVGCGVGTCPRLRFRTTLVCNYAPAGNVMGQRPY